MEETTIASFSVPFHVLKCTASYHVPYSSNLCGVPSQTLRSEITECCGIQTKIVSTCETRISQSHEHQAHSLPEMMTALQAEKRVYRVVQPAGPALGKTVCDHDVGEGTVIRVHHDEND
jgi:hypothetical protein